MQEKGKVVHAYDNPDDPEKYVVTIYEKYKAKCPSHNPKCHDDLYLWLIANLKNPHIWYSCQPIGIQTLLKIVAKLCDRIGLEGKQTNHSLRSTLATWLYDHGIKEQWISEITGHKGITIRNYKLTSSKQQAEVSDILYGKKGKKPQAMSTVSKLPEISNMHETIDESWNLINVNLPKINIQTSPIEVNPVVNINKTDLVMQNGNIVLPLIILNLTVNIQWTCCALEHVACFNFTCWTCWMLVKIVANSVKINHC